MPTRPEPEVRFRASVREKGVTLALARGLVTRAWEIYGGPAEAVVEVALLGGEEHAVLHERFLGDPAETDVMAFPYGDPDLFGEILVNREFARKEAKRRKISAADEIQLYIVHGALHLLGFDDSNPRVRKKMRDAEKKVLAD